MTWFWVLVHPYAGLAMAFFLVVAGLTGRPYLLPHDQLFIDPYTGKKLDSRRWGEVSLARENLLPFLYTLHYELARVGRNHLFWVPPYGNERLAISHGLSVQVRQKGPG